MAQDNGRRPQHLHSFRTPRACCQSSYLLRTCHTQIENLYSSKAIHLQIYLQLKNGGQLLNLTTDGDRVRRGVTCSSHLHLKEAYPEVLVHACAGTAASNGREAGVVPNAGSGHLEVAYRRGPCGLEGPFVLP